MGAAWILLHHHAHSPVQAAPIKWWHVILFSIACFTYSEIRIYWPLIKMFWRVYRNKEHKS